MGCVVCNIPPEKDYILEICGQCPGMDHFISQCKAMGEDCPPPDSKESNAILDDYCDKRGCEVYQGRKGIYNLKVKDLLEY